MWVYGWNLWSSEQPLPPRPSPQELVISRVRHPSFSEEMTEGLVHDLSRRQLRRLWRETTRLLDGQMDDRSRYNLVLLRAHLLERVAPLEPRRRPPGIRTR